MRKGGGGGERRGDIQGGDNGHSGYWRAEVADGEKVVIEMGFRLQECTGQKAGVRVQQ